MLLRKNKAATTISIMGFCLLIFALILSLLSYTKMRLNTYVHAGIINTTGAVRKLNYALSFGKPLQKYYGLDSLIEEVKGLSDDINGVLIMDSESNVIEVTKGASFPSSLNFEEDGDDYLVDQNGVYTFQNFDKGKIVLCLSMEPVTKDILNYLFFLLKVAGVIFVILSLLSYLLCRSRTDYISIKRMRILSLVLIVLSQLAMGTQTTIRIDRAYQNSIEKIALVTSNTVRSDINEVLAKGIPYENLEGIPGYLSNISSDIAEISAMSIGRNSSGNAAELRSFPLNITRKHATPIMLNCFFNRDLIQKNRLNNIIDIFVLIMVAIFISLETVVFLSNHYEQREYHRQDNRELSSRVAVTAVTAVSAANTANVAINTANAAINTEENTGLSTGISTGVSKKARPESIYMPGFRLFVFIEGIAFSLDGGFFSVLSLRMFRRGGWPDSLFFLSGMPNTMYSIAVILGLFFCSRLIGKFGMKNTIMAGLSAGILGYLLCAFSYNLPLLIMARFIFGFCDGLVINSIRLFAAGQENPDMHNRILIEYLAAINLGLSCGVVIGGLISDVLSYTAVFILGVIIGLCCLKLASFANFPKSTRSPKSAKDVKDINNIKATNDANDANNANDAKSTNIAGDAGNARDTGARTESEKGFTIFDAVKELRNPRVLIFMLFVVIPIYISTLFVGYSFPLFGDNIGLSYSLVSGCLMINYLLIAYLTDPISAWILKRIKPGTAIKVYMIAQAFSIGIFVIYPNIWAALLSLIFTSLWDCFGMVVIDSGLDDVNEASNDKTTMLQMVFGKLGMVIGPIAISSRLSLGVANATGTIVLLLLAGVLIYTLSDAFLKRKQLR